MKKRKTATKPPKGPKIEISESSEYKIIYSSGVFGGLDPNDGRIIFFIDRLKPKMKSGHRGAMELGKVERELQVEVHMSPAQFVSMAKWMNGHAQKFGKKKTVKGTETGTSYIG